MIGYTLNQGAIAGYESSCCVVCDADLFEIPDECCGPGPNLPIDEAFTFQKRTPFVETFRIYFAGTIKQDATGVECINCACDLSSSCVDTSGMELKARFFLLDGAIFAEARDGRRGETAQFEIKINLTDGTYLKQVVSFLVLGP